MKGLNGTAFFGVFLLLQLFLVLALWPGDRMTRMAAEETALIEDVMGAEFSNWALQRAEGWYAGAVVETGFRRGAYGMLLPTKAQSENSRGIEKMGQNNWVPFIESRLDTLFELIRQMLVRASLISAWAPYLLILVLPALWDGMMMWRARQTGFYFNSPMVHRYSLRTMALGAWALVAMMCWPAVVHPLLVPALLALIAWSAGNVATHMPKRL